MLLANNIFLLLLIECNYLFYKYLFILFILKYIFQIIFISAKNIIFYKLSIIIKLFYEYELYNLTIHVFIFLYRLRVYILYLCNTFLHYFQLNNKYFSQIECDFCNCN